MDFTSPFFSAIELDKLFVVYDETNGNIISTHRVVTARGTPAPAEQELHDRILEFERQNPQQTTKSRLGVLSLPREAIAPGIVYRVDVSTHTLVIHQDQRAELGLQF